MSTSILCKTGPRTYNTLTYPNLGPNDSTIVTGIRSINQSSKVYITGYTLVSQGTGTGFVYKGSVSGQGTFYDLNFPGAVTNLYGPNVLDHNTIQVVGNYFLNDMSLGCLYEGPLDGSGVWTTILPPNAIDALCHSVMYGLIVGNYMDEIGASHAFIYNIKDATYYTINKIDAISITAYGIWYNGCGIYTICGGFVQISEVQKNVAYLVDWNGSELYNWQTYNYNNDPVKTILTHFDGISSVCDSNEYTLTGDWIGVGSSDASLAFFAKVRRSKCSGEFKTRAKWESITYPDSDSTSGDSVCGNVVIGVYSDIGSNVSKAYISERTCI